jgi:hypothetical protein
MLQAGGHIAVIANARELRKIRQSDRKNDRADAEIPSAHHRSAQMQADLAVIRGTRVGEISWGAPAEMQYAVSLQQRLTTFRSNFAAAMANG